MGKFKENAEQQSQVFQMKFLKIRAIILRINVLSFIPVIGVLSLTSTVLTVAVPYLCQGKQQKSVIKK
jgi:hypothetical protein